VNNQIRIATAFVALVACFACEQSRAAPPPVAPSEVISLLGLNLENEADTKVLYRRLQKAALKVCHEVIGPMVTVEVGKCSSMLVDIAVAEVNRPALTALHGRPVPRLTASR